MWRAILILSVFLAVPAMAQMPDIQAKQGYDACVRIMRSCNSMNPGVRKECPADGAPAACSGIVQAWNAAHPFPGDGPVLTPASKQACDRQAIDNAIGDSAASAKDGGKCIW